MIISHPCTHYTNSLALVLLIFITGNINTQWQSNKCNLMFRKIVLLCLLVLTPFRSTPLRDNTYTVKFTQKKYISLSPTWNGIIFFFFNLKSGFISHYLFNTFVCEQKNNLKYCLEKRIESWNCCMFGTMFGESVMSNLWC